MINELRNLESLGYVRSVEHKVLPLIVWNYTPIVQFDKLFGEYPLLRECRGLITDFQGTIVGKGFSKFFNWEEHTMGEFPDFSRKIEVTEKMDGSLLIVCKYNGSIVYSTRGSFYSDQAIAGANLFRELYNEDWIEDGFTYLFEYISPSNRIVVSYDKANLIHLAKIDNSNGFDVERDARFQCVDVIEIECNCFSDIFAGYSKLKALNSPNKEGFVVRALSDGTCPDWRCKIKFDDYIKLHSIMTHLSSVGIWEYLKDGKLLDEIIDVVPDEFYQWVDKTKGSILLEYASVHDQAELAYNQVKYLTSRKDQASELLSKYKNVSAIVFKMLDGQGYDDLIWKMVKPQRVCPFENKSDMFD